MISNQIMQNTIEGIKAIARVEQPPTARRSRAASSLKSMMTSSLSIF